MCAGSRHCPATSWQTSAYFLRFGGIRSVIVPSNISAAKFTVS